MKAKPLILIVDDEPLNVDYLEQELADLDYETVSAGDGQASLEQVAAHKPDMILLDIMMPVMDGFAVLERLKANKRWRDIPVVVISAMNDLDSVVRGIELGAEDYLPKPFDPVLLEARLTAGLEKKRLRDQEVEYLLQVEKLTDAATAVESASFAEAQLQSVAERRDALGNLARVFQRMAREVVAREQRLRQHIEQLKLDVEEQRAAAGETADLYLPMDRRHALARGEDLPEKTMGTALFADLSGFTPLTAVFAEALGKQRGAEEMARVVKRVFSVLIAEVHRYRGSVINFSGDAITCWFDGGDETKRRAVACGLAMQAGMKAFTAVLTPAGSTISLGLKVAVASGPVYRYLVGRPDVQQIEVLAGKTLDELAWVEKMAARDELLVSNTAVSPEMQTVGERADGVAVVCGLATAVAPAPWPELPPLPLTQTRRWLLEPTISALQAGGSQFMAELRSANALFLQFWGLDFDEDDQAGQKLDRFVSWVQGVVGHYGGYILQLTTGDKGSYLYATFGALKAHEDDALRAVLAALDLHRLPQELAFITRLQIGVTNGEMYVGAYGSGTRRTYGALGNKTNMAARLMVAADAGILCDSVVYRATKDRIAYEVLEPIQVKGREELLEVFRPTAVHSGAVHHSQVDQLEPGLQLTLKVGSVLGVRFSLELLTAIYPVETEKKKLDEYAKALVAQGFWERPSAIEYAFVTPFLQEMIYSFMLFAQRRQLHRALAAWYETAVRDNPTSYYAELAHHWQHAEDISQAIHYWEKAGEQARQKGHLEQAMQYYHQALQLEARRGVKTVTIVQ